MPYLMIFQSSPPSSARSRLKNHQIWQKMKNSLVQLAFNLFLYSESTRNPDFGYLPDPPHQIHFLQRLSIFRGSFQDFFSQRVQI